MSLVQNLKVSFTQEQFVVLISTTNCEKDSFLRLVSKMDFQVFGIDGLGRVPL